MRLIQFFILFSFTMAVRIRSGKNTQARLPDSYRHVQPVEPDNFPKFTAEFGPTGGKEEFGGQSRVGK